MKPQILPVCSNGRPWTKIGVATNEDQARRVVKKHLADESLSLIKNYGFELQVWERTPLAIELNGGHSSVSGKIRAVAPDLDYLERSLV